MSHWLTNFLILKENNLIQIINENIGLLLELDRNIKIKFTHKEKQIFLTSDYEQLSRVFLNIIKNAIESIQERFVKTSNYKGKIDLELNDNDDYLVFTIIDNGKGFDELGGKIKDILNPYFTTKKKGTGLGLAIVNKIINDHNGSINFISLNEGAKIEIKFKK